ncbi:CRISPR-associated helicase Cas3' [Dermatophilus congolensis]|uniref:CRISPR-associated helicase Cas3' n=1 Tax=Dermatophilus congolensis TaxID=1863 RepID=UPI001AAFA5E6|nr:CRISPR-associated helicase Cas3' [Dermatophilus congolensis]MBO3142451.1 CRISPR-associated helicase Cas3' [Dermatophilus congolensis]MBO3151440.1 CRISPR-associated helicase Cas3' [Dermatophilus congolensis]MBO3161556.1 CRISPR-associated helicase Cas3' [Dermatophilus congolensis]MBO3162726.1 CRISPR-associated helicase Cas3' [Dermatophilus congolensis]MBO3176280.1 CRISPR-associated helicase Cas3' [Dermatophilus congolensis]
MESQRPSHAWSTAVQAIWGKTNPQQDSWLPLWRHLEDSAHVAELLWENWLPTAIKNTIASSLPGGNIDAKILLSWLAGIHDIGKATPAFAVKAPDMTGRLHAAGLDLNVPLTETRAAPHGALGYLILRDWLEQQFAATPRVSAALAVPVGAHHGVLPNSGELETLRQRPDYLGGPAWKQARTEILNHITALTGADKRLNDWVTRPLPATVQALVASTVVVADWLASDENRFGYGDRSNCEINWELLALPSPWSPAKPPSNPTDLLTRRFPSLAGHEPTPTQTAAIHAAWAAERPPLIILEAEMGSGKTEAGLAAAEILAYRFGMQGVFMALPTMATSDAMFGRVRSWIDSLPGNGALSMFLAHAKAGLNDEYQGLIDDRWITEIHDDDEPQTHALAAVNSWTKGRRKGVLAPFVVGTIDQILFGALRSKHLALRHLALAGKVLVIDEVHAADTYMREYLAAILVWLGAYGTPVVLMSATLPQAQRTQLVNAYAKGAARSTPAYPVPSPTPDLVIPQGYPRTLLLDSSLREIETPQKSHRPRTITVEEFFDDPQSLAARLTNELVDGGCVAVIRNTVNRAQATWQSLHKALPDTEVLLVHSRFLSVDRAARENDLRARLGRGSSRIAGTRPHRLVLVGTQVLEQSLDIDVDLMVSDLAPVDLLLQRVGRLHRHARGSDEKDRPPLLRTPRLLLTGADWQSIPVKADAGSERVYGSIQLLRAAATIQQHGNKILLPRDIPTLVDRAYAPDLTPPQGWENEWALAEQQELERVEKAKSKAAAFLLAPPTSHEGLLARSGFFVKGDPDDGNGGRSQVRDSEDSLEVVVVQRVNGSIRPMPGSGLPENTTLPLDFPPEPRIARALAGCTVRLPAWSTASDIDSIIAALEDMSFPGWQQDCPWLQGQLVLVLDEQGRARVANLDVAYKPETGLTVTMSRENT